jgi:hypothetical protein
MNTLIGFLIGMFVGTLLAIVVVALCVAAGTRDDLYYNSKESENINNSGRGE